MRNLRVSYEQNARSLSYGLPRGPLHLVVFGEPASKANSRRLVTSLGRTKSIKSAKAIAYAQTLVHQIPKIDPLWTGDLVFSCTIHYASRRPDLDESLILDGLQDRIYKNDRQIKEKHVYHRIDKDNPRAEITLELDQGNMI